MDNNRERCGGLSFSGLFPAAVGKNKLTGPDKTRFIENFYLFFVVFSKQVAFTHSDYSTESLLAVDML